MEGQLEEFDYLYHYLFQDLRRKPLEFLFSKSPENLAEQIIDEFASDINNKGYLDLVDKYFLRALHKLSAYIRERKKDEKQLFLLQGKKGNITFREKLLANIAQEFPKAMVQKRKKSWNRYGVIQTSILFPEPKKLTLIQMWTDELDRVELPDFFK